MQNTYFDSDAECLFLVEKVRGYFPVDYAIESSELQALSFWFQSTKNAAALANVLETEISLRASAETPPETVVLDALSRYFDLLNSGKRSLNGIFTADEIVNLLNANPSPLGWDCTLLTMLATSYGFDEWDASSLFDEELYSSLPKVLQERVVLARKLLGLNPLQKAALKDSLEAWFRKPAYGVKNQTGEAFAGLGFELLEDSLE